MKSTKSAKDEIQVSSPSVEESGKEISDAKSAQIDIGNKENNESKSSEDLSKIDSEIKDLVLFINSLDGITTIGSCQGHDDDGPLGNFSHPYIKFKCSSNRSLGLLASVSDIYYDWDKDENSEDFFQNLPNCF